MNSPSPRTLWSLFLLGALALLATAWTLIRYSQPDIVLITVDTLRADNLSAYGFYGHSTPAADRLAASGATFDNAHCDVTWTTPSMASTMTGNYPLRHGLRSNFHRLADANVTVAERLRDAGYRTAAVVGSYPLHSVYGLDQGFDVYDDKFTVPLIVTSDEPVTALGGDDADWSQDAEEQQNFLREKSRHDSRRLDSEVTEAAVEALKRLRSRSFFSRRPPFFLWVHYFGPHSVPDDRLHFLVNFKRHIDTYAEKVVRTDKEVGRLLDALDGSRITNNMMVVFHSDHGEALGEHKFVGHGRFLYEDNLRIPLIVSWPRRIPAGWRSPELAANVDIAPTMLQAAGIEVAGRGMDGRSLLPLIETGLPAREAMYCETYMPAHSVFAEDGKLADGTRVKVGVSRRGMLKPPWKYIRTEPQPLYDDPGIELPGELTESFLGAELYKLDSDPGELENMAGKGKAIEWNLGKTLAELTAAATETLESGSIEVSEEHLGKLRSLGYVE